MDPVTLIIVALASGAALGLKDAASSTVTDAYGALKALAKRRLAGRQAGEVALVQHKQSPETWEKPLTAELRAAGAASDENLVAAAQALLSLTDGTGTAAGKYKVTIQHSQGIQIGDHNIQTINNGPRIQ